MSDFDSWYNELMVPSNDHRIERAWSDLEPETSDPESDDTEDEVLPATNQPPPPVVSTPQSIPAPIASQLSPSIVPSSSRLSSTILTDRTRESSRTTATSITSAQASTSKDARFTAVPTLDSIAEEKDLDSNQPVTSSPAAPEKQADDQASVSQASTVYDPRLIEDVISRFSNAILRKLNDDRFYTPTVTSRQQLLGDLEQALKAFAESLGLDRSMPSYVKGVKLVERQRNRIARRVLDRLVKRVEASETKRPNIEFLGAIEGNEMSYADKVGKWTTPQTGSTPLIVDQDLSHLIEPPPGSATFSAPSTPDSWEDDCSENDPEFIYGPNVNPTEILENLTKKTAFDDLLQEITYVMERYAGQKMEQIRRHTCLCLQRDRPSGQRPGNYYRVVFNIDWELKTFLENNYENELDREVTKVAAVTGTDERAILCSVGEYFAAQWPSLPLFLPDAVTSSLRYPDRNYYARDTDSYTLFGLVSFDSTLQRMTAEGNQDFIITMAQQISWLSAACQHKLDHLSCAYVGFREQFQVGAADAVFQVSARLQELPSRDASSCWNSLVGPAVIISGFPVPDRENDEHGLEVSVPEMAAMAGIPTAVSFAGGFLFKGRYHALIPVQKKGESVQWHMLDTYPRRLGWNEIRRLCPMRLTGNIKTYAWSRSFVGWHPTVLDLLGTDQFDFPAVKYSNAQEPPRFIGFDNKLTIGFSQWATLAGSFAVGKYDGYRAPRSPADESYEDLLDDARDMPVILYDTTQKRATQTNAEELILQLLMHRQYKAQSGGEGPIKAAKADRQIKSTRETMLDNAERTFAIRTKLRGPGAEPILFKKEAAKLFDTLDGVYGQTTSQSASSNLFKKHLCGPHRGSRRINGWEYMALVNYSNVRGLKPRCVYLDSSSGLWSEYAKDLGALVLFGSNFGAIIQPLNPESQTCARCATLPKDRDFLTLRVDTVETLFEQQGCDEDRARLTGNGWTIQGADNPFKQCYDAQTGEHREICHSSDYRVVQLVKQAPRDKHPFPYKLPPTGAIVIGHPGPNTLKKEVAHAKSRPSGPAKELVQDAGHGLKDGERGSPLPVQPAPVAVPKRAGFVVNHPSAMSYAAMAAKPASKSPPTATYPPPPQKHQKSLQAPVQDLSQSVSSSRSQQSVFSSATNPSSEATSMGTEEESFALKVLSPRKRLPRPRERSFTNRASTQS